MMTRTLAFTFAALLTLPACGTDAAQQPKEDPNSVGNEIKEAFQQMGDGDGTWNDAGDAWADVGRAITGNDKQTAGQALGEHFEDLQRQLKEAGPDGDVGQQIRNDLDKLGDELEDLGDATEDAWKKQARKIEADMKKLGDQIQSIGE